MKNAIISCSGGMDSTSLLVHVLAKGYKNVYVVSFDYGQKHKLELKRLDQNLSYFKSKGFKIHHTRIDLKEAMGALHSSLTRQDKAIPEGHYADKNMKQTVVPNRNAIFSSIIYAQAQSIANEKEEPVEIALGVHSGDHEIYPDCRPEFYESIHRSFKIGNWNSELVNFYLPYMQLDKALILKDCLKNCELLNLNFDTVLANTNTSYAPTKDEKANGKTGSDVERILAFHSIGRIDPVQYKDGWAKALVYALNVENVYKRGNDG